MCTAVEAKAAGLHNLLQPAMGFPLVVLLRPPASVKRLKHSQDSWLGMCSGALLIEWANLEQRFEVDPSIVVRRPISSKKGELHPRRGGVNSASCCKGPQGGMAGVFRVRRAPARATCESSAPMISASLHVTKAKVGAPACGGSRGAVMSCQRGSITQCALQRFCSGGPPANLSKREEAVLLEPCRVGNKCLLQEHALIDLRRASRLRSDEVGMCFGAERGVDRGHEEATISCVIAVSDVQNSDKVGLTTGRQYTWNCETALGGYAQLTRTDGNSMISSGPNPLTLLSHVHSKSRTTR